MVIFLRFYPLRVPKATQDFRAVSFEEQRHNFDQTIPAAFRANIQSIVDLAEARGIEVVLSTFTYNRELLSADKTLNAEVYAEGIAQHNAVMVEIAVSNNLPLVDVAAKFPQNEAELISGPVHMTAEGNKIKARIFADELRELLSKSK